MDGTQRTTQTPENRPRRADAERTIEAILAAAPAVLTANRGASIDLIAERAGVGRATLYRHFPSREALLGAIYRRALADAAEAIEAAEPERGPAADALRRVIAHVLEVGDRYRFVNQPDGTAETLEAQERAAAPMIALIERGQHEGALATKRSARLLTGHLAGLIGAAVQQIDLDGVPIEEASEAAWETFIGGVGVGSPNP